MKRNEPSDPADKWHWRTTLANPEGEWIDSTAAPLGRGERSPRGAGPSPPLDDLHMSSFDLLNGLDIAEEDEAPPDFDELFPHSAPP